MTERRQVRVTEQFFEQLDELFPASRSPEGRPSATDFLLHEMPNVIEKLAGDFETATMPSGTEPMFVFWSLPDCWCPTSPSMRRSPKTAPSRASTLTSIEWRTVVDPTTVECT